MTRILILLFAIMLAFPTYAQEHPLSLTQVEALPFDSTLANTPNASMINQAQETLVADKTEKKAGLPQFDVTTFSSQLFWLLITFTILYVFFANKTLPALSSTIDMRKTTIRNDIETADKISEDVDQLKSDYEAAMTKAHNDARLARVAVENDIRNKSEAETAAFNQKSMDAIAELERKAEVAKATIQKDLESVATSLTNDIITKLSPLDLKDADVEKAVANHMKDGTLSRTTKKAA